jgi:hypothetical protein
LLGHGLVVSEQTILQELQEELLLSKPLTVLQEIARAHQRNSPKMVE